MLRVAKWALIRFVTPAKRGGQPGKGCISAFAGMTKNELISISLNTLPGVRQARSIRAYLSKGGDAKLPV